MYTIKGFITSTEFIDNDPDVVAGVGELSKNSMTYSTEVGIYRKNGVESETLYSFKSEEDGVRKALPEPYHTLLLDIGKFIYTNAKDQIFVNNTALPTEMIETQFGDRIIELTVGSMVYYSGVWVPEWISFSTIDSADYIRLWFSDDAFSRQYDEVEFKIVPPIPDIDSFSFSKAAVEAILEDYTLTDRLNRVEEIKDSHPYTKLIANNYRWYQKDNQANTLSVDWLILVYGNSSNNDLIRETLSNWLLSKSEFDVDYWMDVFPGIFKNNEFIITPLWHKFAIPNQTVEAGFHSPIVEFNEINQLVTIFCKGSGYPTDAALSNSIVSVTPIRTLSFVATGNMFNEDNITLLNDKIKDYINVSSSSLDFTRMRVSTQQWVRDFIELLIIADTDVDDFFVPIGFGKIERDGVFYVTKNIEGVNYLVPTRKSVIDKLGVEAPYYPEGDEGCECGVEGILLEEHINNENNPHGLTATDIDLGNVVNGNPATLDAILQEAQTASPV